VTNPVTGSRVQSSFYLDTSAEVSLDLQEAMSQVDLAAIIWGRRGSGTAEDRGIGLEDGAGVTTWGDPSVARVDGHHGTAKMDRGAVPAAFGYEILDWRGRDTPHR
jgi:hypothetical protein